MRKHLIILFTFLSVLAFGQTNTSVPNRNDNNGVPLPYTTYPPQPSTVTTNPTDRSDVNNNIRPDTTFLKGQSPDLLPPKKSKRKKK